MSVPRRHGAGAVRDRIGEWWRNELPVVLVVALAVGVFWLFREAPELGDDLDYWSLAHDLHARLAGAWSASSFHDFRWPVWGPIWVAQVLGFSGLASYYAAPLLYFSGTAVIVFLLACSVQSAWEVAFVAVIIYVLHPYQDTVFSRPMPDLSEGFWVSAAVLCWMRGKGSWPMLALGGLCVALAMSNRITGALAALALGVAALICHRERWRDLAVLTGAAVVWVLLEWTFWAMISGDFLAVIHANLGGRGRAGTGPILLMELPVRYLKYLLGGSWQMLLSGLLILGVVGSWQSRSLRLVCVMTLAWWLAISCAVQGIDPVRPMLRTSGRFLAGLSPLLAVIGAGGLGWLTGMLSPRLRGVAGVGVLAAVVIAGGLLHERTAKREKFPEQIAEVVEQTSPGRRVLADATTRQLAMLCAGPAAQKIDWDIQKQMVVSTPVLEEAVIRADEVWYFRSKVWNWVLVDLRAGKLRCIPRLASYLEAPFGIFWPRRVIVHGQLPEFHFLTRRPEARSMDTRSVLRPQLFPLQLDRRSLPKGKWSSDAQDLPPKTSGEVVAVPFVSRSDNAEPFMAWVEFLHGGKRISRLEFEPPGFSEFSPNTYFFEIPKEADAWRFRLQMRGETHFESAGVWLRRAE